MASILEYNGKFLWLAQKTCLWEEIDMKQLLFYFLKNCKEDKSSSFIKLQHEFYTLVQSLGLWYIHLCAGVWPKTYKLEKTVTQNKCLSTYFCTSCKHYHGTCISALWPLPPVAWTPHSNMDYWVMATLFHCELYIACLHEKNNGTVHSTC